LAEELGERTELPTGKRLQEARGRGQVAKSQDLTAAIDLIGGAILIVTLGGTAVGALAVLMRQVLEGQAPGSGFDAESARETIAWAGVQLARIAAPALGVMFLLAVLSQVAQIGWHLTTDPLRPRIERLNPVGGFKKLFNVRNLVKTLVNSVKLGLVAVVATLLIRRFLPAIAALPMLEMAPALYKMLQLSAQLAAALLVLLLVIGLADYLYQRWQHTQDLRMTKQEVKEERRSMEGDPDIKAKRFRMAREIAMHRIQQSVPTADVIVTNPTHFSVALKYDAGKMHAPRVVAKGADFLAVHIRHVAAANGVPIVERPPLARGLYWGVDIGREIAPEFYEAVAEVLAYVYRLKGKVA
jgi:flagellar biosynthesis protein FlhB